MSDRFNKERDTQIISFGHRHLVPRVCVVENKPHVRSFLSDMLSNIGFIARDCAATELDAMLASFSPDLVMLGPLSGERELSSRIQALRIANYSGRLMLFGGRSSLVLMSAQEYGQQIGLAMLPPLGTPFRDSDLTDNLAAFLPITRPPRLPVDVDEALAGGWVELWYQPKIDIKSLTMRGAEALVRIRHPTWGIGPPDYIVPSADDPRMRALTEFMLVRASEDWSVMTAGRKAPALSVNIPLPSLDDKSFVSWLCSQVARNPSLNGFAVEVNGGEAVSELPRLCKIARQLAEEGIGLSVDDIGLEGAYLVGRPDLPFIEFKANPSVVHGCAEDERKRAICANVVHVARQAKAHAVADGVETRADFHAVRELGFQLVQGPLFAAPLEPRKFMRTILARHYAA